MSARKIKVSGHVWRSLVICPNDLMSPEPEETIRLAMARYDLDREAAIEKLRAYSAECAYYVNDLYQVQVRLHDHETGLYHLNIRRRDGAIVRDWRHVQQIKNEILGPECEAIELFPAESRLVDTSNKYHLWGFKNPEFRFPFGFDERDVSDDDGATAPGLRQRRL